MSLDTLFKDKNIKPKEKTETISKWLFDKTISPDELISFAQKSKDPVKATCIEAIEFATKINSAIANEDIFNFVTQTLAEKAPRIKWESAKVIGNIAGLFSSKLDNSIENLLINSEDSGTVVHWSTAYALGEILKMKTEHNKMLLPEIEEICNREEKNSIKKIYVDAIKKTKK